MKTIFKKISHPLSKGVLKVYNNEYGWLEITTVYLFGIKIFTEVLTFNTEFHESNI